MDKRFFVILLVIILGFVGIVALNSGNDELSPGTTGSSGSNNVYGKADSPVTLTEFVDFQCEACYAYYPIVKQVKEAYKDRVAFKIRHFPITQAHQFAMQAARNAEAAGRQGKFFEMHDKIFEGQKSWENMSDPQSAFSKYAEAIGLNMDQFNMDRASSSVSDVINQDLADVRAIGGSGTPTFALNGQKIESPNPTFEAFAKMLDDELAKTKQN